MLNPSLIDRQSLGKSIGLPHLKSAFWAKLAHQGRGPAFFLIGNRAYYDPAECRSWIESCRVDPAERKVVAPAPEPTPRRRGRPTKAEQAARRRSSNGEG